MIELRVIEDYRLSVVATHRLYTVDGAMRIIRRAGLAGLRVHVYLRGRLAFDYDIARHW